MNLIHYSHDYDREYDPALPIVDLYLVVMSIGEIEIAARGAADKNGNELIIGRNVLNQLIVTLNGLASVTEIST